MKALRDVLVAANTLAGADVKLGEFGQIELDGPLIDILIGPDEPVSEFGTESPDFIDSLQTVYVDLHDQAAESGEALYDRLYQLRAETAAAIAADFSLGGACMVARYQGTLEVVDESGGIKIGYMRTVWVLWYRMLYTDPTS